MQPIYNYDEGELNRILSVALKTKECQQIISKIKVESKESTPPQSTLPPNAPKEYADRATLWNAVELSEKGQRNLHIHVLLTMRPLTENGEWGAKQKKVYDLDENSEKIPVIDKKTGQQKVDKRNRKQWKCHTVDSRTNNKAE